MVTRQERKEWKNGEIEIYIYTLLYIKQLTNSDILCSTGNTNQYFVMTHIGN